MKGRGGAGDEKICPIKRLWGFDYIINPSLIKLILGVKFTILKSFFSNSQKSLEIGGLIYG